MRFKSNADYIKNHRGMSHSFPAIAGWTVLITLAVSLVFRSVSWWHIGLWVLLAVLLHVLSDLFNSYGTQAFRPVTRRWIAWNIIHIFDPFIFGAHLVAILLWLTGWARPTVVFPVLYAMLAVYYAWRSVVHRRLSARIPSHDPERREGDQYTLLPTLNLHRWNLVRQSTDCTFAIGEWDKGAVHWIDHTKCDVHPAVEASKKEQGRAGAAERHAVSLRTGPGAALGLRGSLDRYPVPAPQAVSFRSDGHDGRFLQRISILRRLAQRRAPGKTASHERVLTGSPRNSRPLREKDGRSRLFRARDPFDAPFFLRPEVDLGAA
ncbi:metal-dependent hydrolase [Cohnella rhizosphaerae]|uniref:metal-dependent hydrolase n=1 Tax=Cohnella rhizosphaerae TaxID=1457232 RepID=UPI0030B90124